MPMAKGTVRLVDTYQTKVMTARGLKPAKRVRTMEVSAASPVSKGRGSTRRARTRRSRKLSLRSFWL